MFVLKESIKIARVKNGMTQGELAERLNVTQTAISHWENGVSMPSPKQIPAIAEVLKISIAELYGETG